MFTQKKILTAAFAAGLASAANAETNLKNGGFHHDAIDMIGLELHETFALPYSTDLDPIGHDSSDDWIDGLEYAQTCCGTAGEDAITAPSGQVLKPKPQKPAQGAITLDNGIKKPGKVRSQGQQGQVQRKGKKAKKQ